MLWPTLWKKEDSEFERLFDRLFDGGTLWRRPWLEKEVMPAIDMRETENAIVVEAELPGMKGKDIEVQVNEGTLTIRGERKLEKDEKAKTYVRTERAWGHFERLIRLPAAADCEKVDATYTDGVLRITIPMKAGAKPRAISVNVK